MDLLTRVMPQCVMMCILAASSFAAAPTDAPLGNPLSIDIPAQPLSRALAAFADQTGLPLVYVSTLGEGRVSHGARVGMPPAAALRTLLGGTGLDFVFLNSRTIKIFEIPKPATMNAAALEEIVVSATKRDESLNKVPISVTVFSAEAIDASSIRGIADLAALTPGVEYDSNAHWGAGVLTNLAIRGVDSRVGASTTGVYIDDAPIQARNGNFGNPYPVTFDLARIEVLRGPQSTLFGAGAEGGAIRFITNEPSTTSYTGLLRSEFSATEYARVEEIATSHNPGPFTESNPRALGDSPSYQADPATDRLNVQLGMQWSRWDIKLFANNVLNSLPTLQRNVDAGGSTLVYAYTFRPRTVGLTANRTF